MNVASTRNAPESVKQQFTDLKKGKDKVKLREFFVTISKVNLQSDVYVVEHLYNANFTTPSKQMKQSTTNTNTTTIRDNYAGCLL